MTTHPSEINQHLAHAFGGVGRLIEDAKKRGDSDGADAWQVALGAVKDAELAMARAREKQNWERAPVKKVPPGEAVRAAMDAARHSPCAKTQRGAVVYRRENVDTVTGIGHVTLVGAGFNGPPGIGTGSCDRSDSCKRDCGKRCVHAEVRALVAASRANGAFDLVHVKDFHEATLKACGIHPYPPLTTVESPTERAWLPSNPPTVESPGQCPWVLPDGDPDEGYWHCKLGDGHSERHVTEFGRGLEEMWLLRCKGDAHTFVGDACRDCGMPVSGWQAGHR